MASGTGKKKKGPVQIRELAKELGISAKTIIEILQNEGYDVKSPFNKVNREMEQIVRKKLNLVKEESKKEFEQKKKIYESISASQQKKPRRFKKKPDKERKEERQKERERQIKQKPKSRPKKKEKKQQVAKEPEEKIIRIPGPVSVKELATIMGIEPADIIKELLAIGYIATINQTLPMDMIELIAENFGYELRIEEDVVEEEVKEETEEELDYERPPIVTVMGHVDHGKTTLIDYIRKSNIAEKEEGKITQRIGAYQVEFGGKKITFIDTPGHEAFTAMRARGAQVTDIVILVVDAREGVKEQTIEALNHAKAAGVKIIVAMNKMDLPDADPEKVKRQLSEHGLIPDDWGGDTIFVPISAKTGMGVDDLLDAILLVAEEIDRRTTTKGPAKGVILESFKDKGRGNLATVIVQRGTLRVGDIVVAGFTYGKVKAMYDDRENRVKEALPGDPVLVQNFEELPRPGDKFEVVKDLRTAREITDERKAQLKEQLARGQKMSLAQRIMKKIQEGEIKELPLVIKADNHGVLEAIEDMISKIKSTKVRPVVIHSGVGNITESDVMLAEASEGVVIGFAVKADKKARDYAQSASVPMKFYSIIYHLKEDIENMLRGLIEPEYREELIGKAEVKAVFKVKGGKVAGSYVIEGVIPRNADKVKVIRDGQVVYEGRIESLKHFQDDVSEVKAGMECGIKLEKFNDVKVGDIIEAYRLVEVKPEL